MESAAEATITDLNSLAWQLCEQLAQQCPESTQRALDQEIAVNLCRSMKSILLQRDPAGRFRIDYPAQSKPASLTKQLGQLVQPNELILDKSSYLLCRS